MSLWVHIQSPAGRRWTHFSAPWRIRAHETKHSKSLFNLQLQGAELTLARTHKHKHKHAKGANTETWKLQEVFNLVNEQANEAQSTLFVLLRELAASKAGILPWNCVSKLTGWCVCICVCCCCCYLSPSLTVAHLWNKTLSPPRKSHPVHTFSSRYADLFVLSSLRKDKLETPH